MCFYVKEIEIKKKCRKDGILIYGEIIHNQSLYIDGIG